MIPQEVAQQLVTAYGLQPPIDAAALLRLFSIQVRVASLSAGVIGLLARLPDWCAVANLHAQIGQALAAAHLLGHYLLHADPVFACASVVVGSEEIEARAFADELMMPAAQVQALTAPITCNTARAYDVPLVQLIRRYRDLQFEQVTKEWAEPGHGEGPAE